MTPSRAAPRRRSRSASGRPRRARRRSETDPCRWRVTGCPSLLGLVPSVAIRRTQPQQAGAAGGRESGSIGADVREREMNRASMKLPRLAAAVVALLAAPALSVTTQFLKVGSRDEFA